MPLNNPLFRIQVFVASEIRDVTAGSGDVSYTGYGFQPQAIFVNAVIPGTTRGMSWGFAKGATEKCAYLNAITAYQNRAANIIHVCESGDTPGQTAVVKSFDADGFTLTWTKVGSPAAGTIYLDVIALG